MRFKDVGEAASALEATLVKELLNSSGAFKGTATAGSHLNADLFMNVLSDAVTKGGGLGIGKMIAKSLEEKGADGKGTGKLKEGEYREGDIGPPLPGTALPGRQMMNLRGRQMMELPSDHELRSFPLDLNKGPAVQPLPERAGRLRPDPGHAHDHDHDHDHGHGDGKPALTPDGRPLVSSNYGERIHPVDGTRHFHTGVDVRAAQGTPILAAAGGVVKRAGERGGYGNAVEIDHGNGVSTLYAHAQALSVQPGDTISEGQALGFVGQTGKATGPHLHFEVRVEGKPIDPRRALNAYGIRAEVTIEEGPNQPSKSP